MIVPGEESAAAGGEMGASQGPPLPRGGNNAKGNAHPAPSTGSADNTGAEHGHSDGG